MKVYQSCTVTPRKCTMTSCGFEEVVHSQNMPDFGHSDCFLFTNLQKEPGGR